MLNRIFGLETEYGLLVNEDRPNQSPSSIAHRVRDHVFQVQRLGVLDRHHRGHDEPPGNGGFLANAGRIYLDMGHLEYASPECATLTDLVACDRAGDRILQQALVDLGLAESCFLIKNNMDHETDATFGSHENYLVRRKFPFSRRGLAPLVSFLVTRQIFTGAGRVGVASDPYEWVQVGGLILHRPGLRDAPDRTELPFQLSQRADFIVNDFFEWVQHNRSIVNTRDEPLADPNQYRRIHLLCGDSNMAEYATALKMGTTGLVLQLIEDGCVPSGLAISEPVETLREVSRDQERKWVVMLESGKSMSAIDIQAAFLVAAEERYRGQDEETDWVLREWRSVLHDVAGNYTKLVGRLDWASKLWLLETFRAEEGELAWNDPALKSLDLEYHNLDPQRGLYFGLEDEGRAVRLTTAKTVQLAQAGPPRNTRAFGRGELVRYLLDSGVGLAGREEWERSPPYIINWSVFHIRGGEPFPMPDPFKTYVSEVRRHIAGCLQERPTTGRSTNES
jgi:proteasome accessory factor A